MMYLKQLSIHDGRDIYKMLQKQQADENGFLNPACGLNYEAYLSWLQKMNDMSLGIGLKSWMVKQTIFWFYLDNIPVGFGKIRHELTDSLREDGGNIGYCIIPEYRGKGYGAVLVRLLTEQMIEMHIPEIIFTCDPDNLPSVRAAQKCQAVIYKKTAETVYLKRVCAYAIKEMTVADALAVHQLNQTRMGYDYPLEATLQKIEKLSRLTTDKLYVAKVGKTVVGYIHANDYDTIYAPHMKNIMGIAVADEYARQGIGKALLEKVEAWAKETGAAGVRLVSGASRQGAHAFYRSCGYDGAKEQKNFKKMF